MIYNHIPVTIGDKRYVLRESLYEDKDNFDYGPAFSLWDDLDKNMLAKASITHEGVNKYEFTVEVFNEDDKRKGIGTFLIELLMNWAKSKRIKYVFGLLSEEDKKKGKWNSSLPFYQSLNRSINQIKDLVFVKQIDFTEDGPLINKQVDINEMMLLNTGFVLIIIQ